MDEDRQFTNEGNADVDDGGVAYEDADSRSSEDSEEECLEVNDTVREEMSKLEHIFQDKGLKFRMIDRIGEGKYLTVIFPQCCLWPSLRLVIQVLSPPSIRPRTYITTSTRMTGISRTQMAPNGPLRRSKGTSRVGIRPDGHATLLLRRSTSPAVPRASRMS